MKKRFTFTFFLIAFILISCFVWVAFEMSPGGNFSINEKANKVNPPNEMQKDDFLDSTLNQYVVVFNNIESTSLKKITTETGFSSLMKWSDTLKNKDFFYSISDLLSQKKIFNIVDYDTSITLSLGESNDILGATGGYLFLKKVGKQLLIDKYRGGK